VPRVAHYNRGGTCPSHTPSRAYSHCHRHRNSNNLCLDRCIDRHKGCHTTSWLCSTYRCTSDRHRNSAYNPSRSCCWFQAYMSCRPVSARRLHCPYRQYPPRPHCLRCPRLAHSRLRLHRPPLRSHKRCSSTRGRHCKCHSDSNPRTRRARGRRTARKEKYCDHSKIDRSAWVWVTSLCHFNSLFLAVDRPRFSLAGIRRGAFEVTSFHAFWCGRSARAAIRCWEIWPSVNSSRRTSAGIDARASGAADRGLWIVLHRAAPPPVI
jgi:hypothetical protein